MNLINLWLRAREDISKSFLGGREQVMSLNRFLVALMSVFCEFKAVSLLERLNECNQWQNQQPTPFPRSMTHLSNHQTPLTITPRNVQVTANTCWCSKNSVNTQPCTETHKCLFSTFLILTSDVKRHEASWILFNSLKKCCAVLSILRKGQNGGWGNSFILFSVNFMWLLRECLTRFST